MKVLVVDDEPLARARLVALLDDHEDISVISEAANGLQAIEQQQKHASDVVLMDIRMPGMDGLEAAGHLSRLEQPPVVIFTTAYDDHALDAYELDALGYLLKPVQKDRLFKSLATALRLAARPEHVVPTSQRQYISAQVAGNLQMVALAEVYYFRAEQKYVVAKHQQGELLLEDTLKQLEAELSGHFIRVHRNALVALDKITGLQKKSSGGVHLILQDIGETIEVSRRHLSEVRKTLKQLSQS